jgi:DNA-binding LytR/AlgR family response regulator
MKCIAIDDEPIALSIIRNFCQRRGTLQLIEVYDDPLQGIAAIASDCPDLVFLDIEMNDLSGLDIAKQLPPEVMVIFTTAHANYALDSYEFHAIDFLHKPFSYDRFDKAVTRALETLALKKIVRTVSTDAESTSITIKVEYRNVSIDTSTILYIEAMDNYIKIFTADDRMTLSQMSLKAIAELLPEGRFVRIHRSFIVSKSKVASYTKQKVKLNALGRIDLPVGRMYANELYDTMQGTDE